MASAQTDKPEACSESTGRPGTSVVLDSESQNLLGIKLSRKITLLQEPKETLLLEYSLEGKCSYCGEIRPSGERSPTHYCYGDTHSYETDEHLTLTFENLLHEVSQDYAYETQIRALIKVADNFQCHVALFAHTQVRTTSIISKEVSMSPQPSINYILQGIHGYSIIHVCVSIIRFSKGGSIREKSPVGDFGQLLGNGLYSDASLVVGELNTIFPVHKHILSLKSEVFKAMFTHEMKEKQEGIVKIEEFDPEVVKELLSYVYTDETKNIHEIPRELFQAAHKYEIDGLKSRCIDHFIFNLNYNNVIDIFDLASVYDLKDLKTRAMAFVEKHETEMVRESTYQRFLCRDFKIITIAQILELCTKYDMLLVKLAAFKFVAKHYKDVNENKEFLELCISHPHLQQEIYKYICSKIRDINIDDA